MSIQKPLNLVFDMLAIAATSDRQKGIVVIAVGTYSKIFFRQKGNEAFETSIMIYTGNKYSIILNLRIASVLVSQTVSWRDFYHYLCLARMWFTGMSW